MANTSVILEAIHFINSSRVKQSIDPLTYVRVHMSPVKNDEDVSYENRVITKQNSQDNGEQIDNFVLSDKRKSNIFKWLGNRNKNLSLVNHYEYNWTQNKSKVYTIPLTFIGKPKKANKQSNITGLLHFDLNMRNKNKKPTHFFLKHSLNLSTIDSRKNRPVFLLGNHNPTFSNLISDSK